MKREEMINKLKDTPPRNQCEVCQYYAWSPPFFDMVRDSIRDRRLDQTQAYNVWIGAGGHHPSCRQFDPFMLNR